MKETLNYHPFLPSETHCNSPLLGALIFLRTFSALEALKWPLVKSSKCGQAKSSGTGAGESCRSPRATWARAGQVCPWRIWSPLSSLGGLSAGVAEGEGSWLRGCSQHLLCVFLCSLSCHGLEEIQDTSFLDGNPDKSGPGTAILKATIHYNHLRSISKMPVPGLTPVLKAQK